jgi:hypothetical protein
MCVQNPTSCPALETPNFVCGANHTIYPGECEMRRGGVDFGIGCATSTGLFTCGRVMCDARTSYCSHVIDECGFATDTCGPLPEACMMEGADCTCFGSTCTLCTTQPSIPPGFTCSR